MMDIYYNIVYHYFVDCFGQRLSCVCVFFFFLIFPYEEDGFVERT